MPGLDGWLMAVPAGAATLGSRESAGCPSRDVRVSAFLMGGHEVTVQEYVRYLNATGSSTGLPPALAVFRRGRWRPVSGKAGLPATYVSFDDALVYCAWLSGELAADVRLPTEDEWEFAARGGIPRARYPWGWGAPAGRACYAAEAPRPVCSYEPNPFGLHDMAGNVFEWCVSADLAGDQAQAAVMGGSWAEKSPDTLRVCRRFSLPRDYRDADVGFRIVVTARPAVQ